MGTDQYLIVLANSCNGSFRGEPGIEAQLIQSIMHRRRRAWTGRPGRRTPSTPVPLRDGVLPSGLDSELRQREAVMACMVGADTSCDEKILVFLRFLFIPSAPP